MRVPLSWLREFAPFAASPAELAATLDDLGLVVEAIEHVGEGLSDVVVVRVEEISAIDGADKIRRVLVFDGSAQIEVVCGAWNFVEGDLVALAPVGAVLPGDFAIAKRKMKGVTSNGMLCSGRELRLSDDHGGILVLTDTPGATPGARLVDVLGIEPDVVFDLAVEANRPDAWCISGVARDLAARLGLPFAIPALPEEPTTPHVGPPVASQITLRLDDAELCPRISAWSMDHVVVTESPEWVQRRLTLCGMRPINNVVDASNYVMLELGQPTHPYDRSKLAGGGLVVRRAEPGEEVTTLDGVVRTMGRPGPGLGDTGQDCLICDAHGAPVGIAGVMGGASSGIDEESSEVLLEVAYFVPMAIARTSKRLVLRTEASARFERGTDPAGIDAAAQRFIDVLSCSAGEAFTLAEGALDERGVVPTPETFAVRPAQINARLGTAFTADDLVALLQPLGIEVSAQTPESVTVVVPTYRSDIRPAPMGEADIAEEVARTYGYSRLPRRSPSWPHPGRLTRFQRERRFVKDVMAGLGADEAWTSAFATAEEQVLSGHLPPYVEITNPLVEDERYLRTSLAPGLLSAVLYNSERRQGDVRFFEVGAVFLANEAGDGAISSERLAAVFAATGDDAWAAMAAWRTIAEALGLVGVEVVNGPEAGPDVAVLHPFRCAELRATSGQRIGLVGEVHPAVALAIGVVASDGTPRRIGWLDLDLEVLLNPSVVARRPLEASPVSRFPSSDIDLAFVAPDEVAAASIEATLVRAGGAELESVFLFDVYRGEGVDPGTRSLAFRLRFCKSDGTMTDGEVGERRQACIDAVAAEWSISLR